jgi:hypothetical protein
MSAWRLGGGMFAFLSSVSLALHVHNSNDAFQDALAAGGLDAREVSPDYAAQGSTEIAHAKPSSILDNVIARAKTQKMQKAHQSFEGCKSAQKPAGEFLGSSFVSSSVGKRQLSNSSGTSSCSRQEIPLVQEKLNSMALKCCPREYTACAGCQKLDSSVESDCALCAGGYRLENGRCAICADSAHWLDDDGNSCYKAKCSDKKHRGLSSNQACCKCSATAGQRLATPFAYPEVNLLLGATEVETVFFPIPRTATRYIVDGACELSKYGLSVHGTAGFLVLVGGCPEGSDNVVGCGAKEPFKVECTVTAYQTPTLNATAKLVVRASHFAYAQSNLVARSDQLSFPPLAADASEARMACVPSSVTKWLTITGDGSLDVSATASDTPGLTGAPQLGIVGGRCTVSALVAGTVRSTDVAVFVPQPWTDFTYSVTTIFATVGEAASPQKIDKAESGLLKPFRFSVFCEPDVDVAFSYDPTTGVAALDGHAAFTLESNTGLLHVAPSKALEATIDQVVQDNNARKQITLTCKVHGYYQEQPLLTPLEVSSDELTIQLRDSVCWVERTTDFNSNIYLESAGTDRKACMSECRHTSSCTDFSIGTSGKCFHMGGVCTRDSDECLLPNITVYTKVPNCGERSVCLKVGDPAHWWVSGVYCPIAEDSRGPVYLKGGSTVPDTLYLAKYDKARDGSDHSCKEGMYSIKQAAPGQDFEDPASDYFELHGATVKCIGADKPDLLDSVFSLGRVVVEGISVEISGQPCGAPNTSSTQDDEEGQNEDGVSPLVLDDPSTAVPADYWMHPCDCFPESWGAVRPVKEESLVQVPAGTNNKFTPQTSEILSGQFVCEGEFMIGNIIILNSEDSGEDACELHCKENGCSFFWEGIIHSSKQCRMYSKCTVLVREGAIEGKLMAMFKPEDSQGGFCRIADPEKCWAVSGRRNFLSAGVQTLQSDCVHRHLIEQCDHKLLVGGTGVEHCSRCMYMKAVEQNFETKIQLPQTFEHGQKIGASCWQERFRPVPAGAGATGTETLTCVSGRWLDTGGALGLTNFACGACLQIASPPYSDLATRGKQELYFTDIMEVQLRVMTKLPRVMLRTGALDQQLDSSHGTNPSELLVECQGRCTDDSQCSGILSCFQRSAYEAVPGCQGKGKSGWGYCVVPSAMYTKISEFGKFSTAPQGPTASWASVRSGLSGNRDDNPTTASCPSGTTITGCTFLAKPFADTADGAKVSGGACTAYNGYKDRSVYAYARCGVFAWSSDWTTSISAKSGTDQDDRAEASCADGLTLTACTCYSPWRACDGAKSSGNTCYAWSNGRNGVFAQARCGFIAGSSGWTQVMSSKSGTGEGAAVAATCPDGKQVTGCTCYSTRRRGNMCAGSSFTTDNKCIAYNKKSGEGVYAQARCGTIPDDVNYRLTSGRTELCDDLYLLDSESACQLAASDLGLAWAETVSWDTAAHGCLKQESSLQVYFNKKATPSSVGDAGQIPLCIKPCFLFYSQTCPSSYCKWVDDYCIPKAGMGECQGDCDNDGECASGLVCFQRAKDENVPGCLDPRDKWDYCIDPVKALTWEVASSKLDLTGLVIKTVPGLAEEQKILESSGIPGMCLEIDGAKGLKSSSCQSPPKVQQLLTVGQLPNLLEMEFVDPDMGLVPVKAEDYAGNKRFDHGLRLSEFAIEQDCGEHALSSLGWAGARPHGVR